MENNTLSEEQIQPFNIDTYYTQTITASGDGFFDLESINQINTLHYPDAFNDFIEKTKENINNIYGYDFLRDNPQAAQEFLENCKMIQLKYSTALQLDGNEEKKIVLEQLKNNLLEELGVYEVFVEKCNEKNIADIENRQLEYAKYISLQEDPKNLTTQQNQSSLNISFAPGNKNFIPVATTPSLSNNPKAITPNKTTKINFAQQDCNEFMRKFFQTSKVVKSFISTKGQAEEELFLIPDLSIKHTDSIETVEKLYPKEVIIRKKTSDGTEGEVLATIDDPFNKFQYYITNEKSNEGEKIKNILEDIKIDHSHQSLRSQIEQADFVFESRDTAISIVPNIDPSFFSIPINRTLHNGQAQKNDKAIKFSDKFKIGQKEFELTDIIMHNGQGSDSGHYYTISKREIELNNGQKHSVFLQHTDDKTICFMKFGNEIQYINIEEVESLVDSYEFATLIDIKESEKIEKNFTNIIYQKEIPSSKINETYSGLKNYGNSCYINSFLAVVAGMKGGNEKQLLLAELQKNGIEFSNNKFSSIDKETDIQDLINILRINKGENQPAIEEHRIKPKIFDQTNNKIESIPKNKIQPSFFSRICDFFASLDPFSCCRGD